ncbi:LacI family DNA-binding transcriptional regulator [Chitinophaga tropicalis]|uniref:Substrate-binding domain-containing protein n=1 Tax=Chitinophaga tropicalis TaxID=2683588 RepID=A0A7K1U3B0_9BACT|nr:substrate-binding domain-containing protein [Chitinophaga tropicalis]MVT08800.1 substrate-binding domain-containing protein [Chitinophaga tropicalis]
MKKKLSIKDIAEQLNVSKTTVSFVLNGKASENGVSQAMQRKVLSYIEKVGYRPNKMAQGLRTGKSKTIGMMVEDISDTFFSTIARKFEEILTTKGYKIIYGSTENNTDVTKELIRVFRNHQVDGYIIAPPPGIEEDIKALIEDGVPVIIFDRPLTELDVDSVLVDNYRGAYKATQHLLANGYKNIVMVTLLSEQTQMRERERGYRQCVEEAGGKPAILKIRYHEKKEKAIADIEQYLKNNRKTDAVFFATNYLAENGLEAIANCKLAIADRIGVVVFDDSNWFRLFKPSITAISQPIEAICTEVTNLLMERLEQKKEIAPKAIVLPTNMIIRNSSVPVKKAGRT